MGPPRRAIGPRRARPALHRSPPGPRGHQPAGVRRSAPGPSAGPAPGAHGGDRRPQRADRCNRPAHRRPHLRHPARRARPQHRRVRHHPLRTGRPRAGHRAHHRAGARPHPAGHDHRVRRQPHLYSWRVRRARLRDRHERGRARARHADPPPTAARHDGRHGRWRAAGRGHRQGRGAGHHRAHRHWRRLRLGHRVPR